MILTPSALRVKAWSDPPGSCKERLPGCGLPADTSFSEYHLLGLPGKASGRDRRCNPVATRTPRRWTTAAGGRPERPRAASLCSAQALTLGKLEPLGSFRELLVRRDLRRFGGLLDTGGDQSIPVEPDAHEAAFL